MAASQADDNNKSKQEQRTMRSSNNNNSNNDDKEVVWLAAVEGGGTTFRVVVCRYNRASTRDDKDTGAVIPEIVHRTVIDSSHDDPARTLSECAAFLQHHLQTDDNLKGRDKYDALGIATFGPVGVNVADTQQYGRILASTPKAAWRNVDLLTPLAAACFKTNAATKANNWDDLAVLVETDVNAPALAEFWFEQQQEQANNASNSSTPLPMTSLAYVTVGTGVGVGLVVQGQAVHGKMHPEGGHVPVPPLAPGDDFPGYSWGVGTCPFDGIHTVEGLASSVALTERLQHEIATGKRSAVGTSTATNTADRSILAELSPDDAIFEHAVHALACLCVTLFLTVSVEKIVLGGGLLHNSTLLPRIRQRTVDLLHGYLYYCSSIEQATQLISCSRFGPDAGLMGAIILAQRAYLEKQQKDQQDQNVTVVDVKQMKKVAFSAGLWHGFLVGTVATALICKYLIFPSSSSRRRR